MFPLLHRLIQIHQGDERLLFNLKEVLSLKSMVRLVVRLNQIIPNHLLFIRSLTETPWKLVIAVWIMLRVSYENIMNACWEKPVPNNPASIKIMKNFVTAGVETSVYWIICAKKNMFTKPKCNSRRPKKPKPTLVWQRQHSKRDTETTRGHSTRTRNKRNFLSMFGNWSKMKNNTVSSGPSYL